MNVKRLLLWKSLSDTVCADAEETEWRGKQQLSY